MVYLTRRYRLSAAHRLHNESMSAEENARLYGKCNNPRGHGHDYAVEVTVAGEVDPRTGRVMDLAVLDALVEREILSRFDHMHLNLDVENFRTKVPTTENLCLEIYRLLSPHFSPGRQESGKVRLDAIRVEETRSNSFEYRGESGSRERT
jgi:6-pyruvoyltetrahydropterin/6-carboxytetrahydropterin synthase